MVVWEYLSYGYIEDLPPFWSFVNMWIAFIFWMSLVGVIGTMNINYWNKFFDIFGYHGKKSKITFGLKNYFPSLKDKNILKAVSSRVFLYLPACMLFVVYKVVSSISLYVFDVYVWPITSFVIFFLMRCYWVVYNSKSLIFNGTSVSQRIDFPTVYSYLSLPKRTTPLYW